MAASGKNKAGLALVVDNAAPKRRAALRQPAALPIPEPVKAEPLALAADMTVAAACHAVLKSCFTHLLDNRLPVLKSEDPEAIHQARVALRRLRAAIAIFRPAVPGEALKQLAADARWLAGEMGPARDLDVFLEEIFAPVAQRLAGEDGLAAYRTAGRTLQSEARERARRALRSRRFKAWRDRMQSWLAADIAPPVAMAPVSDAVGVLYQPLAGFAASVLDRRDRQARRRGKHLARLGVEQRHDLRLSLKKLRYAAEFFATVFAQSGSERYAKRLAKLQTSLGYLNDREVAQAVMARIERHVAQASSELAGDARYVSGLVRGWHEADHAQIEQRLRRAWKRFTDSDGFWS